MKQFLTWLGSLTFVASIVTGWIFVDDRFAHSADVQKQFGIIEKQFTRQEIRELERDIFALKREAQQRKLSQLEQERLNQLLREKERLDREWASKGW